MHWDGTVTLGNLLAMAGYVAGILAIYVGILQRLAIIETKVELLLDRRAKPRL